MHSDVKTLICEWPLCVYHSALIVLPITCVFGVRVTDLYPNTLLWVAGREKLKVHAGPGEQYKSRLCLRHLSPPEETQEEFHHFDTALITTDAFRIRPNSICLSKTFFVWDRTLLLRSSTLHLSTRWRTNWCERAPSYASWKHKTEQIGRREPLGQSKTLLPPSFWSGLSSKHLSCLTSVHLLTNAAARLWCRGLIMAKLPALTDRGVVNRSCTVVAHLSSGKSARDVQIKSSPAETISRGR